MLYLPQLFLVASNDLEKSFVFVTCSLLCWAAFFQRHSPSRLNCSFPSIHIFTGYYHRRLAVGTRCLFPCDIFLQTIVVVGNTKKSLSIFCCLNVTYTEHAIVRNGMFILQYSKSTLSYKYTSLYW